MKKQFLWGCMAAVAASAMLPASAADTYACRVQYLESSGTQYIDTGIVPTWDTMFTATYEYLSTVSGSGNYDMIAGVRTTGAGSTRYYPISLNGSLLKERYVFSSKVKSKTHLARASHTIVFNDENHHVIVDGDDLGAFTDQLSSSTRTCWLFGANSEGNDHWYSNARIYECTLVTNGVPARTYIPVVDEDGEACMFDEVEQKLYRNQGTGSFTAGPRSDGGDVEEAKPYWYLVEYLEATGTQYADTGLLATSNTQTDVGYQYTEVTQTWGAMIGGAQSPSRYYPVSLAATDARKERYVYGAPDPPAVAYPALQRHEVVFNDVDQNVSVDGALLSTFSTDFKTSNAPMYIFAASKTNRAADWFSKSRIWHYDVYENGTPRLHLIPAVDTNGVACFHDLLSGTNLYNKGTGAFKTGRIISSEVKLDLSARTDLAAGLKVLPFEVRPSWGTVFTLDSATAETYAAEVRADGVYLVAKESAGDAARVIDVTGDTAIQLVAGAMPTCSSIRFSGIVRLTADCDWRGLGTFVVPDGAIIDLNGHDLRVAGFTSEPGAEGVISDSSSRGGRLRVEVAGGDVLLSDRVALNGSLKLVKEGAGTFIAARYDQAYAGGTEVVAGAVRLVPPPSGGYRALVGPETSTVTVDAGAEFDLGGNWSMSFNHVLAGGTLTSSRYSRGNNRQVTSLTLTADSVVSNKNFGLIGPGFGEVKVRMNGHTLRTEFISSSGNKFYICHSTFEDEGTIQVGSSWFMTHNPSYSNVGRNITLELPANRGGVNLEAPFTVSNFFTKAGSFAGTKTLVVLGEYRPAEGGRTRFPNMLLADGATFDLSEMGDVPTFNTFDSAQNHTLSFETNATIKVKLGTRHIAPSVPVVAWATPPDNLDTLTFVCGDEGQNYALDKRNNGLYVVKGFMILIR